MSRHRPELRPFSSLVRLNLANKGLSITKFEEIAERHGLKPATFSTYIYQNNAPSVAMLWRLARALSEITNKEPEDVFVSLAKTLEHIDT
jgi:transcriptional regulator with XRE-family HTH domain